MRPEPPFLRTLQHLRTYEEVLLFAKPLPAGGEEQAAVSFLADEYRTEAVDFPHEPPPFDAKAALWGSKIFYVAAQLLLYRAHREDDLEKLLPRYAGALTPGAVLSADLTLRFLPDLLVQARFINPDDHLITLLEELLKTWHYSGVRHNLPASSLDFSILAASPCLYQLYIDRVMAYRKLALALHPALAPGVKGALGLYAPQLWKEFEQALIFEHE